MEPYEIGPRELAELNEDQQVSAPLPPPLPSSGHPTLTPPSYPPTTHTHLLQTAQNVSRLRAGGGVSWLLKALHTDRDKGIATREVRTLSTSPSSISTAYD